MLSDPEARAYAFGRGGSLEFPFPVAVKTGTSQAYRDNWTIGYTREVTVGVWVGNFDREPLRSSSGVAGAGPIFHSVMMAAVQRLRGHVTIDDQPLMPAPSSVTRARICALSGMRANEWCPMQATEWTRGGSRGAAVQLASSRGRRPADDLARSLSHVGARARPASRRPVSRRVGDIARDRARRIVRTAMATRNI